MNQASGRSSELCNYTPISYTNQSWSISQDGLINDLHILCYHVSELDSQIDPSERGIYRFFNGQDHFFHSSYTSSQHQKVFLDCNFGNYEKIEVRPGTFQNYINPSSKPWSY